MNVQNFMPSISLRFQFFLDTNSFVKAYHRCIWQNFFGILILNALELRTLFGFFYFFDSSVTDESFVDETRVSRKYKI